MQEQTQISARRRKRQRGYEGLVGKDQESTYPGGTSRAWLKLKVRHEGAFAIGGIAKDGEHFRGLLLGRRRARGLAYVGFVEYGFTRGTIAELFDRSRRLVTRHRHSPRRPSAPPYGSNRSCWRRSPTRS